MSVTQKTDPATNQNIGDGQGVFRNAAGAPVIVDVTHGQPVTRGYATTDTASVHGTATAPAAAAVFASLTGLAAGVYEVTVYARYSGTPGAADVDNIAIYNGPTQVAVIPIDGAVGGPGPFVLPRLTLAASTAFNAVAIGAGTAGAVYHATIVATLLA